MFQATLSQSLWSGYRWKDLFLLQKLSTVYRVLVKIFSNRDLFQSKRDQNGGSVAISCHVVASGGRCGRGLPPPTGGSGGLPAGKFEHFRPKWVHLRLLLHTFCSYIGWYNMAFVTMKHATCSTDYIPKCLRNKWQLWLFHNFNIYFQSCKVHMV